MRWLIFFLVVMAVLWYIRGIEDVTPPKVEDSFIGGPVKALRKAEGYEKTYLESVDEHKKKMEEQLEKDSGG
jgi:hypothetical protein